ncbi:MAG TPA: hypothetical protein VK624_17045 [Steroidobacteraceae bacterium]|nr:hypothetical protein [Steroidobacteraceae bacterium]
MPTTGLRQAALMASAATVLTFAAAAAQSSATFALLVGSVSSAGESSVPIVVVALDRKADRADRVVHRTFLESKRAFRMPLVPGRYKLYAFADTNRNGVRDTGEAVSVMYNLVTPLRAGEQIELPALRIQP